MTEALTRRREKETYEEKRDHYYFRNIEDVDDRPRHKCEQLNVTNTSDRLR